MGALTSVSRRAFGELRMGTWRAHGDSTWGRVPWLVERIEGRDTLVANPDPNVQSPTGYDQWDVQQRFRAKVPRGYVDVNVQHSTTSDVPRFDVFNDVAGGVQKWAEWSYGPQKRTLFATNLVQGIRGAVWQTMASYQAVEESRIKRRFGQDDRITQRENLDVWGVTSVVRGQRRNVDWETGVDGQWNDVASAATALNLVTGVTQADLTRYADGGPRCARWVHLVRPVGPGASHVAGRRAVQPRRGAFHLSGHDLARPSGAHVRPIEGRPDGKRVVERQMVFAASDPEFAVQWVPTPQRRRFGQGAGKERLRAGAQRRPQARIPLHGGAGLDLVAAAPIGCAGGPGRCVCQPLADAIVQADASLAGDTILVIDGDSARIQMNQNIDRAWVRGARVEVSGRLWPKTTFRSVINWTLGSSMDDAPRRCPTSLLRLGSLRWHEKAP